MTDIPEQERSITEEFRIVANQFVEADGAASLMEEMKTTQLAQMKSNLMAIEGDMSDARAERLVKSGSEWPEYIENMVENRTKANKLKLQLEWIRMRERELDRSSWLERSERKMGRSVT